MTTAISSPINFDVVSENWNLLATYFTQLASIPNKEPNFTQKYGQFEQANDIPPFLSAIEQVEGIACELGSPASLKHLLINDPDCLSRTNPPGEPYAAIVWLANRVGALAKQVDSTFSQIETLLNPSQGDAATRASNLKAVLVGEQGLVPNVIEIKSSVVAFTSLPRYSGELDTLYKSLGQITLLNQANQMIGTFQAQLNSLTKKAAEAKKEADRAWFSSKSAEKKYHELQEDEKNIQLSLAEKQLFTTNMDGFFVNGTKMINAIIGIEKVVNDTGDYTGNFRDFLMSFATSATDDQLSDFNWVNKALDIPEKQATWQALGNNADNFVQSSLVSQSNSTPLTPVGA